MQPLRIKNKILVNLLQIFYTIYLESATLGGFTAFGISDIKMRVAVSLHFLFLSYLLTFLCSC